MRIARIAGQSGSLFAELDAEGARLWDGPPWAGGRATPTRLAPDALTFLAPVEPSKIVAVARNYRAHAAELGHAVPSEPLYFLKPPSALIGPGETIERPRGVERLDFEGEIAVVIGRRLRRADPRESEAAIFGLTVANDITARDVQRREGKFTRAKGYDTFCPVGPWIETRPPRLDAIEVTTTLNGRRRQHGSSALMVFPIPALLAAVSETMTLEPGDLVLTGTPEGVGPMLPGDAVTVSVQGVGELTNPVQGAET